MSGKIKRVALVMGGKSREREVSLASGGEVLSHIDRDRYEVVVYDPAADLCRLAEDAEKLDVAFLAVHGPLGEDGALQGFCEMIGLPYTGSGVLSSAMGINKEFSKRIYREAGLPVAPDLVVTKNGHPDLADTAEMALHTFGSPVVVKPLGQGSSVGLAIVENEKDLIAALGAAFEIEGAALLEKYLPGRELTCAVLGNDKLTALPPIEIIPADGHRFFDYAAKYEPGQSLEVCPAEIPAEIAWEVRRLALSAHKALGCRGLSRTDMIFSNGQTYILETNTLPGLTSGSLLPKAAKAYGLSLTALVSYLIDLVLAPEEVDLESYKDL
ncbi:MAG: D-alanine--D-alanine ligase [Candidatus Adiutrix sp.]|jgi:D-alanine-D-alanine ligase|nr:D-alanine--D-alanine ligase [Candidatus Adiutrix sp.]